jgi:hypothetical protein
LRDIFLKIPLSFLRAHSFLVERQQQAFSASNHNVDHAWVVLLGIELVAGVAEVPHHGGQYARLVADTARM